MKQTLTADTIISQPPKTVFNFATKVTNYPKWTNAIDITSSTHDHFQLGTIFEQTHRFRGKLTEVKTKVTKFKKNKLFTLKGALGNYRYTATYTFSPGGKIYFC